MKQEKDFLREKFVEFQLRIAELTRAVHEQADTFQQGKGFVSQSF